MVKKRGMEEIDIIHKTDFGISFFWKLKKDKLQVIFRDMGFYLSLEELKTFQKNVIEAVEQGCCSQCQTPKDCKSILLKTPSSKIELAVSKAELNKINTLLGATLFRLELKQYLSHAAN